jgi:hypothetical protein
MLLASGAIVNLQRRASFALGLVILNVLNIVDYLLTRTSLKLGAVELNFLLPRDPLGFKIFLVLSGSLILYSFRHKLIAQQAALLLVITYLAVVFYQLVGIYVVSL